MKIEVFIVFSCLIFKISAWRIFHRGRMIGGNLGEPKFKEENIRIKEQARVTEEYFTQKLDHFDPTNVETWQQRYFTNDEFYNGLDGSDSPVFLMIGGEGEASIKWMTQGAWIENAEKYGAFLFQLEHRFYGKSQPTDDMGTDNLKYLTSQQGLADLAYFIAEMNKKYNFGPDTKWIAFGGSYPGSLAAWLRFKFPHLVHAAVSSSGPLLAIADFQDYFKVVVDSLESYSPQCGTAISQGMNQIEILLTEEMGQENLNNLFQLCDRIQDSVDNQDDIANLLETIADNFAGVVQYNKDNRLGKAAAKSITINVVCNIMMDQSLGPPVNRLAKVNSLLLEAYEQECLDYKYSKMIDVLQNTSWAGTSAEGGRQWTYQTCTEFGFYQTSSKESNVFSDQFPLNFFIKQCSDIFGDKFNASLLDTGINRTNTMYGGLAIDVDRVVFVHGSIDPWHALGIIKTQDADSPAIYIEGTAHCANMYPKADNDPPQLTAAREQISGLLEQWLKT